MIYGILVAFFHIFNVKCVMEADGPLAVFYWYLATGSKYCMHSLLFCKYIMFTSSEYLTDIVVIFGLYNGFVDDIRILGPKIICVHYICTFISFQVRACHEAHTCITFVYLLRGSKQMFLQIIFLFSVISLVVSCNFQSGGLL